MDISNTLMALEKVARQLEPSTSTKKEWRQKVVAHMNVFLEELPTESVFSKPMGGQKILTSTDFGPSRPMDQLTSILRQGLDQQGVVTNSPCCFAFIPGGGLFPGALGDYIAAVGNYFAGISYGSPGGVRIENKILRWMCDLVGFPASALGNLTSGASTANQIGISTARDARQLKAKDFDRSVVYLTQQTPHCVLKALNTVGLGECVVRHVPLNKEFRMQVPELRKMIEDDRAADLLPLMIIASAGTTHTGVIHDLDQLADVAQQEDLWFHVDAAYGGFFMLCDLVKEQFKGIERADSVVLDPTKGLFMPYGVGAILVRDVHQLYESQYMSANYLQDRLNKFDEVSPADLSPELTKHFRGLRIWLPLQLFGVDAFKACLEEKIWLCRYFYEKVQEIPTIEVGAYPDLSVMIFRVNSKHGDANEFNWALEKFIKDDGRVMLSSTIIDGKVFLRFAVLCFRSHQKHVDICLEIIRTFVTNSSL